MSREIKIRIWDGTKMYYSDEENPLVEIALTHKGLVANGWSSGGEHLFEIDVKESMQYANFKDKKGKDVYEGDILENCDLDNDSVIGTVVFEDGAFGCRTPMFQQFFPFTEEADFAKWSIVGNIYEDDSRLK